MSKFTVAQIQQIVGSSRELSFEESGKWLVADQQGSKGVMQMWVQRCKDAGLPAFFSASDRVWGVLAEQVEQA